MRLEISVQRTALVLAADLYPRPHFRRRAGIAPDMWPFHCRHCLSLTCTASGLVAFFFQQLGVLPREY